MQSLEDIPTWLSTAWAIDLSAAQIILSTFVIAAFVIPLIILRKDRSSFNLEIVFMFIGMALCVGLGWLPIWILIVAIVIVALAAAWLGSGAIFGKG